MRNRSGRWQTFRFSDELGPAKVLHLYEAGLGLRAILVVDSIGTGPAIGGVWMAEDVSAEECFRLARAMTLKNAAAGLPHGGAKAMIFDDPKQPVERKEQRVRALACAIGPIADYIPGPDMGTDETCMAWIKQASPEGVRGQSAPASQTSAKRRSGAYRGSADPCGAWLLKDRKPHLSKWFGCCPPIWTSHCPVGPCVIARRAPDVQLQ